MAYNLYCNGTPSVLTYDDAEEEGVSADGTEEVELFCCAYALFLAGGTIRYPEYATYNHDLYAMFGGRD